MHFRHFSQAFVSALSFTRVSGQRQVSWIFSFDTSCEASPGSSAGEGVQCPAAEAGKKGL